MDYNARFYSPALGRFIQPDTIIPGIINSQDWNRYAYAYNNPLNYTDPSGHFPEEPPNSGPCFDGVCIPIEQQQVEWDLDTLVYGSQNDKKDDSIYPKITFVGNWGDEEILEIYRNIHMLYEAASPEFYNKYVSNLNLRITKLSYNYGYQMPVVGITLNTNYEHYGQTFMHELWHEIDDSSGFFYQLSSQFEEYVGSNTYYDIVPGGTPLPMLIPQYDPAPGWPSYGSNPPPNRREDFAESATEYFYTLGRRINEGGLRWIFIEHLLTTGEVLTP